MFTPSDDVARQLRREVNLCILAAFLVLLPVGLVALLVSHNPTPLVGITIGVAVFALATQVATRIR